MQTQDRISASQLDAAIALSQNYLLSKQNPSGFWWSELESNVTMTAEIVLLHKIWGTDKTCPLHKAEKYLRLQQRDHGGWELYHGDGGELSTSVEAYMALRLLGISSNDSVLVKAREFILARGGITKTRIFTKLHLALIGCYSWQGLPSLPPWLMLLHSSFSPFTIYELSSWARSSLIPLIIVLDRKPIYLTNLGITLNELYTEGAATRTNVELSRKGDWTDIFIDLDNAFKFAENFNLVPFREEGLKAAEKWLLEHQELTGDWGGIIPAMLNSLLALRCLNYDVADPFVDRGLQAIERFAIETENTYQIQACVSPIWDTALVIRSLIDSGLGANHPALVRGGQWLLDKQIMDYGDWSVKNSQGKPGGWAFEFDNRFYPDVDDSAVVVMALQAVQLPNESLKQKAMARAVDWISTMQCKLGGWAAFDLDNDQYWLNEHPYGDLKALIDPNTADVTARVLEMVGRIKNRKQSDLFPNTPLYALQPEQINRALAYLVREQESEGCWFGRWGVNYIYGTSGVLTALALIAPKTYRHNIERGVNWLVQCQNPDGGWGETCESYKNLSLKGKGLSTASQTSWALIGLLAVGEATGQFAWDTIKRGVDYLLSIQSDNGTWDEDYFTGTGFPGHFYLKYHLYQQHFPLTALGRYRNLNNQHELPIPLHLKTREQEYIKPPATNRKAM